MKSKSTLLCLVLCLFFFYNASAQTIVINEIMSSNTSVITDDDEDYEDWVELYFTGSEAFNLEGYGLSDDPTLPFKWVFPEYWIEPGQHLLIWCSEKNRTDIEFDLHTNFKINSSGEIVQLTRPNGTVADIYLGQILPINVSYGRQTDGATAKVFFQQPTPAASNNTPSFTSVVSKPIFSITSGFFSTNQNLTISHPDPTVTIVYTLDGSEPSLSNLNGTIYNYKNQYRNTPGQPDGPFLQNSFKSWQYSNPITLVNRSNQPNDLANMSSTNDFSPSYYIPTSLLKKGTVVKAKAFKMGAIASETVTHSYFIFPEGAAAFSLPVVSLSLTEKELFDYQDGIFVAGIDFDTWRDENPNMLVEDDLSYHANYSREGRVAEKEANFSYFINGNNILNQKIGLRINGNFTRTFQSKSFRIIPRDEYGDADFDHQFFANNNFTSFKTLVLRHSGNDFFRTMFRDAVAQKIVKHLRFATQEYQPTVTFVNGEYWGILNLRERYDDDYFKRVFNINKNELDLLEDLMEITEGDEVHYQAFLTFLENNSLANAANYSYVNTQIDVDNFIDYYLTQIYFANQDWLGNNVGYFRKKTSQYIPNAPLGQDGRWRWFVFDLDGAFGYYQVVVDYNMLDFATATDGPDFPNPPWSTFVFRKMLESPIFRTAFLSRFADMMNTTFLPNRMVDIINETKNVIASEIPNHITRWSSIEDVAQWNVFCNELITFSNQRIPFQRQHLRQEFNIANDIAVTLQVNDASQGFIKINTIDIRPSTPGVAQSAYPWNGTYFSGVPITLKAIALPGYQFSHWSGASSSTNPEIVISSNTAFTVTAHFTTSPGGGSPLPIYFWAFDNNLPNDIPLTSIGSTYEIPAEGVLQFQSCLSGYPFTSASPNWRKASMERRNNPTNINYMPEANFNIPFETANIRGIQIKQPFQNGNNQNTLILNIPTTGYRDVVLNFAAVNELAANAITVEYSITSPTASWITTGLSSTSLPLTSAYQLFTVDFSAIPLSDNNPNFKIRLRFTGTNMTQDLGNRVTFNNISLKGTPFTLSLNENESLDFKLYPNPVNDNLTVIHFYQDVEYSIFSLDGKLLKRAKLEDQNIDCSQLLKGIYLIEFECQNKRTVKKIIKR